MLISTSLIFFAALHLSFQNAGSQSQVVVSSAQSPSECMCPCMQIGSEANTNFTENQIEEKVDKIVNAIAVNTKETSVAKSKKISAPDDRPTAKAIGTVGIVVLSVTLGCLLLFDLDNAIRFIINVKNANKM